MDLYGIGFSNIRMPNDSKNYVYKFEYSVNTFPEEVFVHEFLHTLERTSLEYGYNVPELHDYEKYGYEEERLTGQKKWYEDYMKCNITDANGNKVGLNSKIYTFKPAHKENFEYSITNKLNNEPQNLFEEIIGLIKIIKNLIIK